MRTRPDDDGLTLIELLVVFMIIGILAGIAIPSLIRHKKHGYRAAANADMKNAATAIETWASDHEGVFAGVDGADETSPVLAAEGFNNSEWISLQVFASAEEYCIRGYHTDFAGQVFVYRSGTGAVELDRVGVIDCV